MNPIYKFYLYTDADISKVGGMEYGKAVDSTNGTMRDYPEYNCTGYIPISPGCILFPANQKGNGAFFDRNKKYCGTYPYIELSGEVKAPDNAVYVRMNIHNTVANQYTLSMAKPVFPNYKDDLAKEYELETNQRFYRPKLSGKITFQLYDYDYIRAQSFETMFVLYIYKSNDLGASWSQYYKGKFMNTDCEFSDDDKKCTVQPDTLDEYNDVLAGLEKEYNLISLAPEIVRMNLDKRPLIQVYIPGDSVVSCFLGGDYWEQDANAVDNRNDLVNKYYFALCNLLKEIRITVNGTPTEANGVYAGRMSVGNINNTFTGTLSPDIANGYYIEASQQYAPPFFGVVLYRLIRRSDNQPMFTYTATLPGNQPWDNVTFTMQPVQGSGATGTVTAEMATYNIYARYLCDVDKINDLNTYALPTEDIVENNRNYKRAIGYAIDVAYISNNYSSNPTEWGLLEPGKYFMPPYSIWGQAFFPIARSTWRYASVWFGFSAFDWILEEQARKTYMLRDAYPVASCIQQILAQFAPGITHQATPEYSEFLYGNSSPLHNRKFTLLVTQKTNILVGDYDQPAQKAPTTLQQFTNMLRDCFRCFWYIEDGKFKIEHILWFRNGGSYSYNPVIGTDITQLRLRRNGKPWGFASSSWSFDKVDMPERYQFEWMDDVTKGFEGYPIDILSKYVTAGKIENVSVSGFTTDVDYMLLNPGEISKDGFALFAAVDSQYIPDNYSTGGAGVTANVESGGIFGNVLLTIGQTAAGTGFVQNNNISVPPGGSFRVRFSARLTTGTAQTLAVGVIASNSVTGIIAVNLTNQNQTFTFDLVNDMPNDMYPGFTIFSEQKVVGNVILVTDFTVEVRNQYKLPYWNYSINGLDYILQNGLMSWLYLQPQFYIYDLPARRVKINNSETYAQGIERKKKQVVEYPSNDDPNPMQLIKTYIGNGQVNKISITLHSRMNKVTLNYDTE